MISSRPFGPASLSPVCAIIGILSLLPAVRPASAAISSSGSVSPSPPQTAGADPVIGVNDVGRFTITPSSVVNSDVVTIGQQFTGIGYAVVSGFDSGTGSGAVWNANNITVGSFGTGSLEILDGGIVSVDFQANPSTGILNLGVNPDSVGTVVVSGRGSLLRLGNDTNIGHNSGGPSGSGTLIIEDEGYVIATNDAISGTDIFTVGVRGRVELAGGRLRGEVLNNNGTIIGHGRIDNQETIANLVTGRVEVGSGERLVINGGATGGVGFDNDGEIVAVGGEIEFLEQFVNTNQAASVTLLNGVVHFPKTGFGFDSTGGVLASTGGVNDIFGTVRIQSASSRIVVGGESTAVFHEPVTNSGATIEVFPGSTAIYLQGLTTTGSSSALAVHLADPTGDPDFGSVEVGGAATLDGTLQVKLAGGYTPANGDSFQILSSAGGISGSLSLATAPVLATGLEWALDVNAANVVLSIVSNGDYNGNGVVDAADYVVWRETRNQSGAGLAADGNGNGTVDAADYDYWRSRFGNVVAPGLGAVSTAAIPEPATLTLFCLTAMVSLSRRREGR
jgi:T5SS/PEP-CTERM-associated repeat protein